MESEELHPSSQPSIEPIAPHSSVKAKGSSYLGYVNLGLPSKYQHAADMGWPSESQNAGSGVQSVESEYQMYAAGTLTKMDINLPRFWEVRLFSFNFMNHSKFDRAIETNFQPSSGWHWIIYLFKPLQFLVNGHSPQVQRLTQTEEIVLAQISWKHYKLSSTASGTTL